MAKKKGSKVRKKRHLLILEIGGVAVLAALVAGLVLYRNVFSDTRDAVLEEYMGLIEKKEYEKMYDLLDTASQESVHKEDFITRNKNIYEGIEAKDITLDIAEEQDTSQPLSYRVTMETLAGEVTYDGNTFFEKEKGTWRIVWDDSMIFPDLGKEDKVSVTSLEAKRGSIYDRNGVLLAGQGTVQSVGLVPGKMNVQAEEDIQGIAAILGTTQENIETQLAASWVKEDSFVPLKEMTQTQLDEPYISPEGIATGASIQDKLLEYPGVLITEAESRVYPYGESTSHLLGYVQQINAEELEEMKKENVI